MPLWLEEIAGAARVVQARHDCQFGGRAGAGRASEHMSFSGMSLSEPLTDFNPRHLQSSTARPEFAHAV